MPAIWGSDHYPWIHAAALVGLLLAWPVLARFLGRARALWAITLSLGLVVFWAVSALRRQDLLVYPLSLSARVDLEAIRHCIGRYQEENAGRLPADIQELVDRKVIKNYSSTPRDPWGNEYMYEQSGESYRLFSYGADGKPGGKGEAEDIEVVSDPAD